MSGHRHRHPGGYLAGMRYALAAVMLATATVAHAAGPSPQQMIEAWNRAGETCSGSTRDEQQRSDECARAEALRAHLNDAGWCYGRQGEAIYQRRWHQCGASSLKPNDLVPTN